MSWSREEATRPPTVEEEGHEAQLAIGSAGTVPIKTFDPRAAWPEGGIYFQTALTSIEAFLFFSKRLRSLRATAFPSGFVPLLVLTAKASQWRVLRRERKRPRSASKICVL